MTYVDIHILQSVPPSNINRDDTGSPKSAVFGGVRRARVSSQAWKRATRKRFNATLESSDIGFRTKRVVDLLSDEIKRLAPALDEQETEKAATDALKAAGIKKLTSPKPPKDAPEDTQPPSAQSEYLLFLSAGQLTRLAELAVAAHKAAEKVDGKLAKAAIKTDNSFDVALFGRMVADDAELNVDAAVQVAHALSVHGVEPEFDYFTAVDDLQERDLETGAGMIGTVEFSSSTLYRYATVNVPALYANLADARATARAVATFVESWALSMPTGKQNTFANRTVPDAIVVCFRNDQPINLVGAFETPVVAADGVSVVASAARRLVERHNDIAGAYHAPRRTLLLSIGDSSGPLEGFGERVDMAGLVSTIEQDILTAGELQ